MPEKPAFTLEPKPPFEKAKLTIDGPVFDLNTRKMPSLSDPEQYTITVEVRATGFQNLSVYELAAVITKYLRGDRDVVPPNTRPL